MVMLVFWFILPYLIASAVTSFKEKLDGAADPAKEAMRIGRELTKSLRDAITPALQGVEMTNDVVYQTEPGSGNYLDPDRFLRAAKKLAVDNYNRHHNPEEVDELDLDDVYIVWFAKVLGNWKAIVSSNVARGLLYEVSYNGHRAEATIDVFRKINTTRVAIERL